MEPLSLTILLFGTAASGIIGNRSDSILCKIMNHLNEMVKQKPLDYYLQSKIRKSYLQATLTVCEVYLTRINIYDRILKSNSEAIWFEKAHNLISHELKQISKAKIIDAMPTIEQNIELVLKPKGVNAEQRASEIITKIKNEVIIEFNYKVGNKSSSFEKMIIEGWREFAQDKAYSIDWFELFSSLFGEYLKSDARLRDLLQVELLSHLTIDNIPITLTEIEQQLEIIGKDILGKMDSLYFLINDLKFQQFQDHMEITGKLDKTLSTINLLPDMILKELEKVNKDVTLEHISEIDKNKQIIENETKLERLSFGLSLYNQDPELVDHDHHYQLIKRFDFINNESGMYSTCRWLTIVNIGNIPTNFIVHMECGENKIYFDSMKFEAYDKNFNGRKLIVRSLTKNQPNFEQRIRIYFPEPVAPNNIYYLCYKFNWPGEPLAFFKDKQSMSISLTRLKHGLSKLIFGVFEIKQLMDIYCEKLTEDYLLIRTNDLPIKIHAKDIQELNDLNLFNDYSGYYYSFNEPNGLAYRIHYQIVLE